ncbi:hypothetical protein Bbelb_411890 [Branchiostoma belcheri]|nr:hypothetical protein Bbelb_411890 [Branchiostoma belcheri]
MTFGCGHVIPPPLSTSAEHAVPSAPPLHSSASEVPYYDRPTVDVTDNISRHKATVCRTTHSRLLQDCPHVAVTREQERDRDMTGDSASPPAKIVRSILCAAHFHLHKGPLTGLHPARCMTTGPRRDDLSPITLSTRRSGTIDSLYQTSVSVYPANLPKTVPQSPGARALVYRDLELRLISYACAETKTRDEDDARGLKYTPQLQLALVS